MFEYVHDRNKIEEIVLLTFDLLAEEFDFIGQMYLLLIILQDECPVLEKNNYDSLRELLLKIRGLWRDFDKEARKVQLTKKVKSAIGKIMKEKMKNLSLARLEERTQALVSKEVEVLMNNIVNNSNINREVVREYFNELSKYLSEKEIEQFKETVEKINRNVDRTVYKTADLIAGPNSERVR